MVVLTVLYLGYSRCAFWGVSERVIVFDGKFLQDLDATELNFKTSANNFDVLHFAMHTIIDDENPMYSKMVFTLNNDSVEDGFLNTYEIYNLDLDPYEEHNLAESEPELKTEFIELAQSARVESKLFPLIKTKKRK